MDSDTIKIMYRKSSVITMLGVAAVLTVLDIVIFPISISFLLENEVFKGLMLIIFFFTNGGFIVFSIKKYKWLINNPIAELSGNKIILHSFMIKDTIINTVDIVNEKIEVDSKYISFGTKQGKTRFFILKDLDQNIIKETSEYFIELKKK